jgi:hypothetical protein
VLQDQERELIEAALAWREGASCERGCCQTWSPASPLESKIKHLGIEKADSADHRDAWLEGLRPEFATVRILRHLRAADPGPLARRPVRPVGTTGAA